MAEVSLGCGPCLTALTVVFLLLLLSHVAPTLVFPSPLPAVLFLVWGHLDNACSFGLLSSSSSERSQGPGLHDLLKSPAFSCTCSALLLVHNLASSQWDDFYYPSLSFSFMRVDLYSIFPRMSRKCLECNRNSLNIEWISVTVPGFWLLN